LCEVVVLPHCFVTIDCFVCLLLLLLLLLFVCWFVLCCCCLPILASPQTQVAGGNVTELGGGVNVWARLLSDGSVAACLFNAHLLLSRDISVSLALLGISGTARVRDLWQHRELPNATFSFTAKGVPPGTAVALRFWSL
jgi:hypothetical protein